VWSLPFGGPPLTSTCSSIHSCIYFIPGAFEIEINGQLVFSKLENGGFPYEKDVSIWSSGRTPWDILLQQCIPSILFYTSVL
jgi:hypothetical protein